LEFETDDAAGFELEFALVDDDDTFLDRLTGWLACASYAGTKILCRETMVPELKKTRAKFNFYAKMPQHFLLDMMTQSGIQVNSCGQPLLLCRPNPA
jgi:hypothetical protein